VPIIETKIKQHVSIIETKIKQHVSIIETKIKQHVSIIETKIKQHVPIIETKIKQHVSIIETKIKHLEAQIISSCISLCTFLKPCIFYVEPFLRKFVKAYLRLTLNNIYV
jgi:hypothetical protein